jgi:hypothetical protein
LAALGYFDFDLNTSGSMRVKPDDNATEGPTVLSNDNATEGPTVLSNDNATEVRPSPFCKRLDHAVGFAEVRHICAQHRIDVKALRATTGRFGKQSLITTSCCVDHLAGAPG